MAQTKKVSIIVPIYNCEQYLERSINSILNQTYQNLELILVDDGSTDNSLTVCQKLIGQNPKIKLIHQDNAGVSGARNMGLKASTGELVGFVDADDYVEPTYVEKLVAGLAECDLAICGFNEVAGDIKTFAFGKDYIVSFRKNWPLFFECVKKIYLHNVWNKIYRRDKITTLFDTKYFVGEDVIFNLNYLKNCDNVAIMKDVLYDYNTSNQNSAMHTKTRNHEEFNAYWDEIYAFCENYFTDKNYLKLLNGTYLKAVIAQTMNLTLKKNLKYPAFKQVFREYRNTERVEIALKKYDLSSFAGRAWVKKILVETFKLKLKFLFFMFIKRWKYKLNKVK